MNITEAMIEAGARVLWLAQTDHESAAWDKAAALPIEDDWRQFWRETARACLTTALAAAAPRGAVLAVVPETRTLPGATGTEAALDYAQGWNACRAAALAGRVVV